MSRFMQRRVFLTSLRLTGLLGCCSCCYTALSSTSPSFIPAQARGLNYRSGRSIASCERQTQQLSSKKTTTSSAGTFVPSHKRTYRTIYDAHYRKHGTLLRPSIMHAILAKDTSTAASRAAKNILVIGDVHGCLSELQQLHQMAITTLNGGADFRAVILVGDLVNKGPSSAEVVRYVRNMSCKETNRWYSVRGNHDDAALKAALGDEGRRGKDKYRWVEELSDEEVQWLSELPYTLRIPQEYFRNEEIDTCKGNRAGCDTVIVHAGFIPGLSLEEQGIGTMVNMREVACTDSDDSKPWAQAWSDSKSQRPYRVIFGHDARRGLQRPNGDMAIGLDTGAVYGGQLTGIVLPSREIVSVDSQEYCPVGRKQNSRSS